MDFQIKHWLTLTVSLAVAILALSCGGGGGGGDAAGAAHSTASRTTVLAPDPAVCPFGGILIETGIDENGNGLLDAAEVDNTQTVCNGADGINTLVDLSVEPAGDNCEAGGIRIDVGPDSDRDGLLDPGEIADTAFVCNGACTDLDTDGFSGAGLGCGPVDCDDSNPLVNPLAPELCNGLDDDCDGAVDELIGDDLDGDSFASCSTTGPADCDDTNALIFPGATEECNGYDDNCDSVVDEGFDADGDGYAPCPAVSPIDCDDDNALINPDAEEIAGNSIDDNCNGFVDELQGACTNSADAAAINDLGFSSALDNCVNSCDLDPTCIDNCLANGPGLSTQCAGCYSSLFGCLGTVCRDICIEGSAEACQSCWETQCVPAFTPCAGLENPYCSPVLEKCDGLDNDCDGLIDESFDADSDGFTACPPSDPADCNDADALINPDAVDASIDGIDQNCDGLDGPDQDGDGVLDSEDNCPLNSNPEQLDEDSDGVGNSCDNCPDISNPGQEITYQGDVTVGDACNACIQGWVTCGDEECYSTACVPTEDSSAVCVLDTPFPGNSCDDANPCTENDACDASGVCVGTAIICDDGNPCTDDFCGEFGCYTTQAANDTPCDDANDCTAFDACFAGTCSGESISCEDLNPCTVDSCDINGGCVSDALAALGISCDDDAACTTSDQCDGSGNCVGAPVNCDDGFDCTDDSCSEPFGCTNTPNDTLCDDGNPATQDLCAPFDPFADARGCLAPPGD